jgi:simple sugar transport system substrate-binding protein
MLAGEANASVELTPNMAGPAFDALIAMKKDGTQPKKFIQTQSALILPDMAQKEYDMKKNMGY